MFIDHFNKKYAKIIAKNGNPGEIFFYLIKV